MYKLLINNYIKKLTKDDIVNLSNSNNIYLSISEIDILYYYIKNYNQELLYGDYNIIFNDLKNKISSENYNKIFNLFIYYKNIYSNYL